MNNMGTLDVTTPSDREIVMTRVFDAPRTLVFDAWTKPELVRQWLTGPPGWTMVVCEIDLRVGGHYRHMLRNADGAELGWGGVYREIAPPERLVTTELFDEDWTGGETLVTLVLTEEGGSTTVTMTVLYSSREARDGAMKTGMEEGMVMGYDRLAELLASMMAERG
ncbi:MAG: SRPBCC family protein [Dehalococcoidia bacterium]